MCGFVAIVNLNREPVSKPLLAAMANKLSHRGPDTEGLYIDANVGLYHKRLSIIDVESGAQPMTRAGVTVVFNGEIYNYIELRSELRALGFEFSTRSDTEVLLASYLTFGREFVKRLNGMFAFVIHDERSRKLIAARDHFGIKPLYRFENTEHVLYASEIKALLCHPAVKAEVDRTALDQYVTFQHTLGDRTLFSQISRVAPATVEVLNIAEPKVRSQIRYWKPNYSPNESISEREAVDHLQELIRQSVKIQLRSDVPLGTYLSGGLDSSTVTMLAAQEYNGNIGTFTGAFQEGIEFDESRYAAEVAEAAGTNHHVIYPTENDFVESLSFLSHAMDEPAAGPGLFPQYIVSRLAADNVKVCLGGQGGDEVFGGYARYSIAYLETALRDAMSGRDVVGEDQIRLEELSGSLPMLRQYQPMMKRFFGTGMFESEDRRYFTLLDRSDGSLDSLSNEFRTSYDGAVVFDRFQTIFNDANTDSYFNRMMNFDLMSSLPALLQVEDRVSMAVSLESRVPLLDYTIMDFIASLPTRLKLRGGEPKYLFKKAIKDWLPASIFNRTDKMGFPVPLHIWSKGAAREFIADTLLSQPCRQRGLFDHTEVERLISNESAFGRGIWGLLQIELWHLNFIDKDHH